MVEKKRGKYVPFSRVIIKFIIDFYFLLSRYEIYAHASLVKIIGLLLANCWSISSYIIHQVLGGFFELKDISPS